MVLHQEFREWQRLHIPIGVKRAWTKAPGLARFAEVLDEHERTLRRIMFREVREVQLDTADRLCVKLSLHLEEVYPL